MVTRLRAHAPEDTAFLSRMLGRAGFVQAVQHNSVYGHRQGVEADKTLTTSLGIPRARPTFDSRVDYTPGLFLRTLRRAAATSFETVERPGGKQYGTSPVIRFVNDTLTRQRTRA